MSKAKPLSLIVALSLSTANARASEPQALSVAWEDSGPLACAKPEGVEAEVLALAGSGASASAASFQVRVEGSADGYRLTVGMVGEPAASTRQLASCAELRETAILIMAMALGPTASEPEPEPEPEAEPVAVARGVSPRWTASAGVLVDLGSLPGVGAGPQLGVGYASGLWRIGLLAHYFPARSVDDLPAGVSAELDSFAAGVQGALLFRFASTAFGPRAELELGYVRGSAEGVVGGQPERTLWAALLAGLEVEVWFQRWLGMQLCVLTGPPLRRPRFAFTDSSAFYTTAPVVVRGMVGLLVRLDTKE